MNWLRWVLIKKIVSGGQTGADQAALDAALKLDLMDMIGAILYVIFYLNPGGLTPTTTPGHGPTCPPTPIHMQTHSHLT